MGQEAQSWAANASFDNGNEKDSNLYLQIALRQIWFTGQTKLMWNLRDRLSLRWWGCIQFLLFSFGARLGLISKVCFPDMWGSILFKWELSILPPNLILMLRMLILQVGEAYLVALWALHFLVQCLRASCSQGSSHAPAHAHTRRAKSCWCLEMEFTVRHVSESWLRSWS